MTRFVSLDVPNNPDSPMSGFEALAVGGPVPSVAKDSGRTGPDGELPIGRATSWTSRPPTHLSPRGSQFTQLDFGSDTVNSSGSRVPNGDRSVAPLKYNICRCICMSSRNIAVQTEVYDALAREKRRGESFTSLLRRLLDQREGLEEIVGAWGRSGARTNRAALRSLRATGRRSS